MIEQPNGDPSIKVFVPRFDGGCRTSKHTRPLVDLVRDVTEVVRSVLNFFPHGRNRVVANEQAAEKYWLRRVTACL
jgi:hypothetical protein